MYLGVIADDFTGGTDLAGFLVKNGLSVIQFIGVPETTPATLPDAAVISLKSRSCPAQEAVRDSLAALAWLRRQNCRQIFFKYRSTFDSTAKGNIGPVTDALLDALEADVTVMAPALPVNGRSVYCGYLFVNGVPLNESGMRHHPVTPMLDANLMRLTESQARGKAANIPASVMEAGAEAIETALDDLRGKGIRYVVPDTLTDAHLTSLGEAVSRLPLVTGGSGLGAGLARHYVRAEGLDGKENTGAGLPPGGKGIVLSGSASARTNAQVARYKTMAASLQVGVRRAMEDMQGYAEEMAGWAAARAQDTWAPLIHATVGPEELASIQKEFGAEASGRAVEAVFAALAALLKAGGFNHFIVAGGETAGAVVKALGIKAFYIGPQIAPGVPWVRAADQPVSLALKSGNFGDEDFFAVAQGFYK
jgi:uncharacterized protein YgbK (DUF1537 family)